MSDPGLAWLAAAFAISWLIIGAYLVRLARAQRDIDRKLDQLPGRDSKDAPPV